MPKRNGEVFDRFGSKVAGHPATSDTVEYSEEELQFMKALDRYKREKRRPFPTCREVLGIIKDLGYVKTVSGHTQSLQSRAVRI